MQTSALRVLVLEDHLFQRSIAVSLLKKLGCEAVFAAGSGAQALDILHQVGPVDVALCDLHMEDMDGLEFLQRAAQAGLIHSVIINSALAEDVRRAARQLIPLLGLVMLGDLGKPLHSDAVLGLLNKYLNDSHKQITPVRVGAAVDPEEVRSAMTQRQMETYFQPKINLLTGEVVGVEALTRWNHPFRGVVSPAVFMPAIESCNLLNELFFSQLEHGMALQRQVLMSENLLNIAFNLQPVQLTDTTLVARVKAILARHGLAGSGITFELTENGLVDASPVCLENLVRLRMMGCRLSIDDFGVGYSSLQRLCQLPFNEIKLDGEFVRALDDDPRFRVVVSSTLAMGEALGMTVVAEGIETPEQCQQLVELGCTEGQGYLFARPMTQKNLLGWLDAGGYAVERL